MQISIHPPTPFIKANLSQLLPAWPSSDIWVIVVLQQANFDLLADTLETQLEKDRLRSRFIQLATDLIQLLKRQGGEGDYFDPKTGYPGLSPQGTITHSDVATIQTLLGYETTGEVCKALIHPIWQTAIYPSVLVSSRFFRSEQLQELEQSD